MNKNTPGGNPPGKPDPEKITADIIPANIINTNKTTSENNMMIPLQYYRDRFRDINPEETAKRCVITINEKRQAFSTKFLSRPVLIFFPEFSLVFEDNNPIATISEEILLARFLLNGKLSPFRGSFLAYNEIPWGSTYERQFDGRCVKRLARSYGNSIPVFKLACEALGGVKSNLGDISYDILLLPGLIIRLILWEGDDEFPPSAQILFSDNFPDAFSAEDMAVIGDVLLDTMKKLQSLY